MKKSLYSKEYLAFVNELYTVRIEKGLRQSDLAERLNVPQSFISKYETGERRLDIVEIKHICKSLGIRLIDLVERVEKKIR